MPLNVSAQGTLLISEFRLRGPSGANDEFIEIYNNSGADHVVAPISGTGYGIAASDGMTRCTIPNGRVIPDRGHFLCVNSVAYSLGGYAAGSGNFAIGNASYTTDIPDNAGIALFNNNTGGGSYSLANRFDAVGSTSEANTLYKEGSGYPALTPFSIDYSFSREASVGCTGTRRRKLREPCPDPDDSWAEQRAPGGQQQQRQPTSYSLDTNGTSAGAGQRLGAPGPRT